MSVSPVKNLDPPLRREGIVEKKLPHAGLILPWPWNQVEREDLGLRVWVRGEGERARAGAEMGVVRMREWLGERGEWFK